MLKKFIVLSCFLFIAYQIPITAQQTNSSQQLSVDCAPQLQPCLKKILQIPEAKNLIAAIQQEGPIRIKVNNHPLSNQFGAYWDVDERTICVSLSSNQGEGELIGSIIFELHNAFANAKLDYLDKLARERILNRESYVKAVEFVEYENSLAASKLAKKGIDMGIFPRQAHLPTYKNFEEHYRYQRVGGHSVWIERNYDQLF